MLNQRQQKFVELVIGGMSPLAAYKSAGYEPKTARAAETSSSALMKKHEVKALIAKSQEESRTATVLTRSQGLEILSSQANDSKLSARDRREAVREMARLESWAKPEQIEVSIHGNMLVQMLQDAQNEE